MKEIQGLFPQREPEPEPNDTKFEDLYEEIKGMHWFERMKLIDEFLRDASLLALELELSNRYRDMQYSKHM